MEKQWIMILTIGPAEDFMAQARTLRDLWFGSFLLSELGRAAAGCLDQEYHALMAAPYIAKAESPEQPAALNTGNQIIGVITTEDPREAALKVRRAVVLQWLKYAEQAKAMLTGCISPEMWDRQVKDFIEVFVVWSPLGNGQEYAEALHRTEQLLASRQTLRDFRANEPAKLFGDLKSSLYAGRESVLYTNTFARYARLGIARGEHLDAVSLIKRLARFTLESGSLRTCCDVALHAFREKLQADGNEWRRDEVKRYVEAIRSLGEGRIAFHEPGPDKGQCDSRFFYKEHIDEAVAELSGPVLSDNQQQNIAELMKQQLAQLYQTIRQQPSPYYALVMCSTDQPGAPASSMDSPRQHREYMSLLAQLSLDAANHVEQVQGGQMIYSGGDACMAIVPVQRCLQVALNIHEAFAAAMEKAVPDRRLRPALSAGISIARIQEPVAEVLRRARLAEELAQRPGNGLALHCAGRSGSRERVIGLSFSRQGQLVAQVTVLQELYREGRLSSSFVYGLRELHDEYAELYKGSPAWKEINIGHLLYKETLQLERKSHPKAKGNEEVDAEWLESVSLMLMQASGTTAALEQLDRLAEQCLMAMLLERAGDRNEGNLSNSTA